MVSATKYHQPSTFQSVFKLFIFFNNTKPLPAAQKIAAVADPTSAVFNVYVFTGYTHTKTNSLLLDDFGKLSAQKHSIMSFSWRNLHMRKKGSARWLDVI